MTKKLSKNQATLIQLLEENGYSNIGNKGMRLSKKISTKYEILIRKTNQPKYTRYRGRYRSIIRYIGPYATRSRRSRYRSRYREYTICLYFNEKRVASYTFDYSNGIQVSDLENSIVTLRRICNRLKLNKKFWMKNTKFRTNQINSIPSGPAMKTKFKLKQIIDKKTGLRKFSLYKTGMSTNPKTKEKFKHNYRYIMDIDESNVTILSNQKKLDKLYPIIEKATVDSLAD